MKDRKTPLQNGVQKNSTCRNPSHKDAEPHRNISFVLTVDVVDTHDTLGDESEKEEEERETTNEEKESVKKIDLWDVVQKGVVAFILLEVEWKRHAVDDKRPKKIVLLKHFCC